MKQIDVYMPKLWMARKDTILHVSMHSSSGKTDELKGTRPNEEIVLLTRTPSNSIHLIHLHVQSSMQ